MRDQIARASRLGPGTIGIHIVAGGGATAISALVVLSSVALGGTFNAINHVAPYRGGTFSVYNQIINTCASHNRFGVAPNWNNATGVGGWTSVSSARSCVPAVGQYSGGFAAELLTVGIPLRLPSGAHSVQVVVSINFTGMQTQHIGGACPTPHLDANGNGQENCGIYSDWCFSICIYGSYPYLWDQTNNTFVYDMVYFPFHHNYTYTYNQTSCSSFKCTYNNGTQSSSAQSKVNTVFTWYFNSTMVKTHRYWAVILFSGFADTSVQNYPASRASASLNFATFGEGFKVTSVTVV